MPKILINEKDKTSPGTPAGYANYAVLIAGFVDRTPITTEEADRFNTENAEAIKKKEKTAMTADAVQADANGVYEFSSAEAFKDVIGLVKPKRAVGTTAAFHYGNQMAYELLKMGYTVVYKPISSINDLGQESTWEIFKDKANYDFRFITHGLLESSDFSSIKDGSEAYEDLLARYNNVIEANKKITAIKNTFGLADGEPDNTFEGYKDSQEAYEAIKDEYAGFISYVGKATNPYDLFDRAEDTSDEVVTAIEGVAKDLEVLKDKLDSLEVGLVAKSLINDANTCIANLAKYVATGANDTNDFDVKEPFGRGDCVALIELDEKSYVDITSIKKPEELIIEAINKMGNIDSANGKYCAMTVPSVCYKMTIDKEKPNEFDNNVKFPGAFHYLACFINSLKKGFAEWYAVAGYTRGVASYMIDYATVKLGEIAINALEPRNYSDPQSDYPKFACNVIANFRGSYYLWGNRTAHPLGKKGSLTDGDLVASSFLNIRQLCCTIKKQLYVACRSFTFDPNSDTLWVNFCNAIRPTLDMMKADQGIRDYKIIKVFTDKKATLKAKIRIIPIEAVEDFDLEVSLEDSFGETAAVVNE
jgi:hypothetical protein